MDLKTNIKISGLFWLREVGLSSLALSSFAYSYNFITYKFVSTFSTCNSLISLRSIFTFRLHFQRHLYFLLSRKFYLHFNFWQFFSSTSIFGRIFLHNLSYLIEIVGCFELLSKYSSHVLQVRHLSIWLWYWHVMFAHSKGCKKSRVS